MSENGRVLSLADFDADGALQESAERLTRRSAISVGALLALGGTGMSALLADEALAQSPRRPRPSRRRDIDIVNFALNLEYLEADFYVEALRQAGLTGPLLELTRVVSAHETAHVRFLRRVLTPGQRIRRPRFDFRDTTSAPAIFHRTSVELEETGVRAYSGQGPNLRSATVLAAATSILTVEARHAAAFRQLLGLNPAPRDFDTSKTKRGIDSEARRMNFGYRPVNFRSS